MWIELVLYRINVLNGIIMVQFDAYIFIVFGWVLFFFGERLRKQKESIVQYVDEVLSLNLLIFKYIRATVKRTYCRKYFVSTD